LPNGNVLVAPVLPNPNGSTIIYNVATNSWMPGGQLIRGGDADEQSWVKLADGSILTVDGNGGPNGTSTSERYIPSLNQWVNDANLAVTLFSGGEIGAAFLLPDGRAFFLGASGHTALYTPSGASAPGTWAAGPDIPNGNINDDGPGAVMVNGKVLCDV